MDHVEQGGSQEVKDGSKLPPLSLIQSFSSDNSAAPDGVVVMGDMLVPQSLYQAYFNSSSASPRKGVPFSDFLWPRESGVPTVPYVIDDRILPEMIDGMNHWMAHTCLNFRPAVGGDMNWVRFIQGSGCWSYIGNQQLGAQDISIGIGCETVRTVVHEVGHAIGLFHEQMRSDRDNHVVINWENIIDDYRDNFNKITDEDYTVPFDYRSIMHYGGRDFTKNDRTTIATKLPEHQGLLGRTEELTHRDKHIVNLMYGCIDDWELNCPSGISCEGEGYLGRSCTCVCPPGREGDRCEIHTADYYDDALPACSTKLIQEVKFTSPNYPGMIPSGTWCVYTVEAPQDQVPEVIFHSFSLRAPIIHNSITRCYDSLEVRYRSQHDGDVFCEKMISPGDSFTSSSSILYLYLDVNSPDSLGFEAEIKFHAKPTLEPTEEPTTRPTGEPTTEPREPTTEPTEESTTEPCGASGLLSSSVVVVVTVLVVLSRSL